VDVILKDGDLKGVVVIGSSAGGIEALRRFMSAVPTDLPVAVCVVLHIPATSRSLLAEIIARSTQAPASAAIHDERPEPGHIYVAPPDRHLIVRRDRLELDPGPKENGVRPAVDPLFRSAATAYGANSAAVVLSGALSDGAIGAAAVAAVGGLVLVQDPADAIVPSMPEAALRAVPGAVTADAPALAAAVAEFARTLGELEEEQIMLDDVRQSPVERSRHRPEGPPSGFTCPECHGPLWEFSGKEPIRYRCRVGHVYDEDHLVAEKSTEIEAALWAGLEALEERAELLDRVARRMQRTGRHERARSYRERVAFAQQRAEVLRDALRDDEDATEAIVG
jgi:two-component system chemotaxis response regulator CheB